MTPEDQIAAITAFLGKIGIPVEFCELPDGTFLPGILIDSGTLKVDVSKLTYPGDLLHEAGHIAVSTPEDRREMVGGAEKGGMGEEIVAILWSFAAAKAIDMPEEYIFHAGGYKGHSVWHVEQFRDHKNYIGLPLLEWMGMTASEKKAQEIGVQPFPHMIHWLRQ